jgi:hypothetical protein
MRDPFLQNFKPKDAAAHTLIALAAMVFIASALPAAAQTAAAQATARVTEPSLQYTVKPSDKLIVLSKEMFINQQAWNEVARYNQLKNPDMIMPGQKLDIPLRFLKSKPSGGKIISADGDVTMGNSPMQVGAAITDGSKLRTGANSSAVIELGDGSRVKLLPNSLAEVVTNRDYAMRDASASGSTNWFSGLMRLSAGTLEALASKTAKRATPLQVETPTSLVGVRGTEFRVAFDDPSSASARTEVIEGKVRADNPAQKAGADLPTGTGAVLKPAERDIKVVNLLPAPDLAGIPSDVFKPQGSWAMPVIAGAVAYRVQVSDNERFDKIVRDLKVTTASADLSTLANGNWFARVRGIDPAGLEGFDTAKLIAVKDGQWRVSYSSLSVAGGKTVLSWIGQQSGGQPMPAGDYTATLASDQALTQGVTTADGTSQQLVLGELKPGTYFIRLRARSAQGATDSATYRFVIDNNWGRSVVDKTSPLQAIN